jgi:hypothetical protein
MLDFKALPVGQTFWYNGNEYTKKSTRTAYLHEFKRVFYFGQNDIVRIK